MNKTKNFSKTKKQREAIDILGGPELHDMLYGGSRSGKSFILAYAITQRASDIKSRHLACRFRFNHAKTSLWMETFPKVFDLGFPNLDITDDKTNYIFNFPNGSEIWIGGLDEKKRTEKILGKEYSTIWFNECSQIPYGSINIALTRLAEQNGLKKKAYYDENPPSKRHWSYYQFIQHKNPEDWSDLDSNKYKHLLMNPQDNIENIAEGYIENTLNSLPEKERLRFRDGEFSDDDDYGIIYYAFKAERHIRPVIKQKSHIWIGMDFNINPMTAVVCQHVNGITNVIDEFFVMGSDTRDLAKRIRAKYGAGHRIVPDSTGKRKQTSSSGLSDHEILKQEGFRVVSAKNPFRIDRYNTVNTLFERDRVFIDPKCVKLIKDLEQVSYKEGSSLVDDSDSSLTHVSDALGYLLYFHDPIMSHSSDVRMIKR